MWSLLYFIAGELEEVLYAFGVFGVFLVSFLSNAVPYSTIPYLSFIIVYAAHVDDLPIDVAIVFAGGLGAALGKIIVYYIGRTARRVLSEDTRKNIQLFAEFARKSTFIAVFLFAALPLPDDILYVPLGMAGYSITRYFIALLLGKIVITGAAVFFGSSFSSFFRETQLLPYYIYIPLLLLLTIMLTYVVIKINWAEIAKIGAEKGTVPALKLFLKELFKVILSPFKAILRIIGLNR